MVPARTAPAWETLCFVIASSVFREKDQDPGQIRRPHVWSHPGSPRFSGQEGGKSRGRLHGRYPASVLVVHEVQDEPFPPLAQPEFLA